VDEKDKLIFMVPPIDFLDTMAWSVAVSATLFAIGSLTLPYDAESCSIKETAKSLRLTFAVIAGVLGLYMFISGISIGVLWPFTFSGGIYNVLFGGIATFGGLILLAGSATLFLNGNARPLSYLVAIGGLYAVIDAVAMLYHGHTTVPVVSALSYLSFAATAFLSVPATHSKNRLWLRVFAISAFVLAAIWLFQASSFTWEHLIPS
jgi:uncharacterized membrane protein